MNKNFSNPSISIVELDNETLNDVIVTSGCTSVDSIEICDSHDEDAGARSRSSNSFWD